MQASLSMITLMAETKYESKVTTAAANADKIFTVLSNLRNIEKVKDLIPQDKVQEMDFDEDFVRFKVDGLGQKIKIAIVEREPNKTIKFELQNIPMQMNFWIQLKQVTECDTKIKLTIKADLPMMFKMMLDKKLQEGLDQAAVMLAQMPFEAW